MTKPKKRYPPNNVTPKKHRPCKDCIELGNPLTRPTTPPGPRCATHHRERRSARRSTNWETRLMALYGITADEYWDIYEFQGGYCYICRRYNGKTKKLSVDHCHTTGLVRGLLCLPCNRNVLGHLRDDCDALYRAVDYLLNPPAVDVIGDRITPNGVV